jgi:hypothetical protein
MTREDFVRAIVIAVRTQMDTKYPVSSDKVSSIREEGETLADALGDAVDDVAFSEVFVGMVHKLGHVPKGERLSLFKQEAQNVSDAISAPPPKVRGTGLPTLDPEQEEFRREIARDILIRVRAGMDPRYGVTKERAVIMLRDAEKMADEFLARELDTDTREVVVALCAHVGSIAHDAALSKYIEQAKIVSAVLQTPRRPPSTAAARR